MKKFLRQQKLAERLSHHPEEKKQRDQRICQKLLQIRKIQTANTIVFYLPIHGEVDLRPFYRHFRLNKKFVLPRVVKDKKMDLHVIKNLKTEVKKGSFNIWEPSPYLPKVQPKQLDVVLIPGVAFSVDGHRVGYGMGFYDRVLKKTKALKIGVAYDFQIVKNGAGEKHDVKMDMIVTEKKIIRVGRPQKKAHTS